jgi:hypothetical protein
MTVRAKFKVVRITRHSSGRWDGTKMVNEEVQTIHLFPVSGGPDTENGRFFANTPSGTIELGTLNKAAADQFDLDGEYYIDFTRAD